MYIQLIGSPRFASETRKKLKTKLRKQEQQLKAPVATALYEEYESAYQRIVPNVGKIPIVGVGICRWRIPTTV